MHRRFIQECGDQVYYAVFVFHENKISLATNATNLHE